MGGRFAADSESQASVARESLLPKDPRRYSVSFSILSTRFVTIGQSATAADSTASFEFPARLAVRVLLNVVVVGQAGTQHSVQDPEALVGLGVELYEEYLVLNHKLLVLHLRHLLDLLEGFEGQQNH